MGANVGTTWALGISGITSTNYQLGTVTNGNLTVGAAPLPAISTSNLPATVQLTINNTPALPALQSNASITELLLSESTSNTSEDGEVYEVRTTLASVNSYTLESEISGLFYSNLLKIDERIRSVYAMDI